MVSSKAMWKKASKKQLDNASKLKDDEKKKNTNGENYRINTTNVDLTFSRRSQDIVDVSRV